MGAVDHRLDETSCKSTQQHGTHDEAGREVNGVGEGFDGEVGELHEFIIDSDSKEWYREWSGSDPEEP